MIETGVLWIRRPESMLRPAGGMLSVERQLFTFARAGLKRAYVEANKPPRSLRLPEGLDVRWLPEQAEPPFVGVSGDHYVRVDSLRHIVSQEYGGPTAYHDGSGSSVVQVLPSRQSAMTAPAQVALPEGVATAQLLPWLLRAGFKPADGFMAKHFDRHISLAISRSLLESFITPNMITVVSTLIGLAGAYLFSLRTMPHEVAGSLLFWFHSVVDGVDGELARMRFQESKFGWTLDFWGDNLVHVALFSSIAYGWAQAGSSAAPFLGAAAVIGTLGSAFLAYTQKLAGKGPLTGQSGPDALSKLETMLTQRDFVYILPVIAYFGYMYYFLWAAGVGSLLFFTLMLYLRSAKEVRTHEQTASTAR
jgi:phosphatidylglycerophosphate synthase